MAIKYMFATECSKPDATKAIMGKKIAHILPVISVAAILSHTARTTSQLHKIPRTKACPKGSPIFPAAMERVLAPIGPFQRAVK